MTKNQARTNAVKELQGAVAHVKLKHHDALKILADARCARLVEVINYFSDVSTYADAVDSLENDPQFQLLCETCGWTFAMICPECSEGCGCSTGCTGYRHGEFSEAEDYDYGAEGEWDEDFEDWEEAFARPGEEEHHEDVEDYDDDQSPAREEPSEPEMDYPEDWPPPSGGGWGGADGPVFAEGGSSEEPPF